MGSPTMAKQNKPKMQKVHLEAGQKYLLEDDELKKRGYIIGNTLGEGSYAKVKSAFSTKLDRKVAVKIINKKKAPKEFVNKFLPRELDVMKTLKHRRCIETFAILEFDNKVYIIMEMAGHGDLLDFVKLRGALPDEKAQNMAMQLCEGLRYIHSCGLCHRDLKCENVLLDSHNYIKITDFGFARWCDPKLKSTTYCGSTAYAAPEVLQGVPYRPHPSDIWSLGVIFYIMVCGTMPFDDSNVKRMIRDQIQKRIPFKSTRKVNPLFKDLTLAILESEITKRFIMEQVMQHTWLEKISQPPLNAPSEQFDENGNNNEMMPTACEKLSAEITSRTVSYYRNSGYDDEEDSKH